MHYNVNRKQQGTHFKTKGNSKQTKKAFSDEALLKGDPPREMIIVDHKSRKRRKWKDPGRSRVKSVEMRGTQNDVRYQDRSEMTPDCG